MGQQLFANFAGSTLSGDIVAGDLALSVVSAVFFPAFSAGDWMYCVLADQAETTWEIVKVTALSGSVFTVVRAQDGTAAAGWPSGSKFQCRPVAQTMRDALTNVVQTASNLTIGTGDATTLAWTAPSPYTSISAVYVSDWQGRMLQYSTLRTNLTPYARPTTGHGTLINGGTGSAPTATYGYATGPDGTASSAMRLQAVQGAGATLNDYSLWENSSTVTLTNAVAYSGYVWLKSNTGSNQTVYLAWVGNTGYQACVVTPTWQRFQVLITGSGAAQRLIIGCRGSVTAGGSSIDVLVDCAQIETGSSATSWIATTTAAASWTDYNLSGTTIFFTAAPVASAVLSIDAGAPATIGIARRELLTAARTYYVRTDGSDSNSGLANTSGGAFLTVQKAIDVVCGTLDMGIYQVTIQVADGTYGNVFLKAPVGSLPPIIRGNTTTPANVVFTASSGSLNAVALINTYCSSCCIWTLQGIKMTTTGTGNDCIMVSMPSRVIVDNCDFGTCVNRHMDAQNYGQIWLLTSYKISGGAKKHALATLAMIRATQAITVTITGTTAFSEQFAYASVTGTVFLAGITFSGSATGIRYTVDSNGIIYTNGGGATYLPGDAAAGSPELNGGRYI